MTKIQWTDATLNVFSGCSKVSPGCDNCYAERMAPRLGGRYGYPKDKPFKPTFHPDKLSQPLSWKKPRKIFVCSMGDLFHKDNPFEQIAAVYGVMASCPQHIFQVLTKRPERMKEFYNWLGKTAYQDYQNPEIYPYDPSKFNKYEVLEYIIGAYNNVTEDYLEQVNMDAWPLPNLWLGVTAENQEQADKRIPVLLQIPAEKRFVSIEPMLSGIDLTKIPTTCPGTGDETFASALTTDPDWALSYGGWSWYSEDELTKLDWVIVGGENGPGARPCHSDWVRSIRDQCKEAGTAFFFKGWGADTEKIFKQMPQYVWENQTLQQSMKMIDGVEYKEML